MPNLGTTELVGLAVILIVIAGGVFLARSGALAVLRMLLILIAIGGTLGSFSGSVGAPICATVAIGALAIIEAIFVAAKLVIEVLMARMKKVPVEGAR
jgi:hypothetical protein